MKDIKRIVITQLLLFCCAVSYAQSQTVGSAADTIKKAYNPDSVKKTHYGPVIHAEKPKGPKPIKHELSLGLRLNTDGWSAYTDIGRVKSNDPKHSDMFYNVRFWELEFTEKKNPGEEKSTSDNNTATSGTSTYVYGKINNFYALKLGYGFRKMLAGKPDPGTVSIHWENVAGASIGFLKPYYLNVYSDPTPIKYSPANAAAFLNQSLIEGSAGFSKGIGEIVVIPGFHFKSALHFDFSANRKNVIALEAGVNAEIYTQSISIMANRPSAGYFLNAFLALQFGRRW